MFTGPLADTHRRQLMQDAAQSRMAREVAPKPTAPRRRMLRLPALGWGRVRPAVTARVTEARLASS
jgi:hypothetical protein